MSGETIEVHGSCAPEFEPVRDAFIANFAEREEVGASVAVVASGEPVVNLWAGWADPARTRPWRENTLTNVFSTTKAVTSLCAHILIDRGELDPDAPVAHYWPEFAQAGKADIPVRWIMCHRSGVTGVTTPITVEDFYDWDKMTGLLAQQEPLFPPGTASGYHSYGWGWLMGEIIRRVTSVTCGQFAAAEVAGPVGADFHIGLAASDLDRCSELEPPPQEAQEAALQFFASGHPAMAAALANPATTGAEANSAEWRMAELPSANGHTTALALATIFGALADGSNRLISADTLEAARAGQGHGTDLVLGFTGEWGLGFVLSGSDHIYGPNPAAFGHNGFGGSAVAADPEAGLAFAYVMNKMGMSPLADPRMTAVVNGLYKSVGQT